MRKLLTTITSLCLIVCIGCKKQSVELPIPSADHLPSMYITIDDAQKDSIYTNRNHKADAFTTIVSVDSDTICTDIVTIKTRGNATFNADKVGSIRIITCLNHICQADIIIILTSYDDRNI